MKNKPLIIGESGERPWSDGPASKCLWSWFDVKDYAALVLRFNLANASPKKGSRLIPPGHLHTVNSMIEHTCLVFLVGKFAQTTFFPFFKGPNDDCDVAGHMWKGAYQGRFYVGLPYPTSRNAISDSIIKRNISFILDVWRSECSSESLQS